MQMNISESPNRGKHGQQTERDDMNGRGRRDGGNWLEDFVPYQLYRITNALNQRLRSRLREESISLSRWRVLGVLRAAGTLTINEIAQRTAMEQPTVSRTVTRLVRDGLASRRASTQDSRFVDVSLTEDGQRAFEAIYPLAARHQASALRGFSEAELETLRAFLRRIQHNIGEEAERRDTPGGR